MVRRFCVSLSTNCAGLFVRIADCFNCWLGAKRLIQMHRSATGYKEDVFDALVGDEAHTQRAHRGFVFRTAEHGGRAALHRFLDEDGAVHFRAGQRGKQIAGLDLAAVAREPGEFRRLHGVLFHLTRRFYGLRLWCHYGVTVVATVSGFWTTPKIGAMREITRPASGAAVVPARMPPPDSGAPCGVSSSTRS